MKRFLLLPLLALAAFAAAESPVLVTAGKVISQPSLKEPLGKEWSVAKGKWTAADGVLTADEIEDEHHAAVVHLATGPTPLVWECDFKLGDAGKIFYVGCDSNKHVGRLVVTPKKAHLAEDSTENKATKTPGHVLAEAGFDAKPNEWQHLRLEYAGDQMVARLNGAELRAQHPYLATPKVRWWFAASGHGVQMRNIRISEGVPVASGK
jgi:hypothetical protein